MIKLPFSIAAHLKETAPLDNAFRRRQQQALLSNTALIIKTSVVEAAHLVLHMWRADSQCVCELQMVLLRTAAEAEASHLSTQQHGSSNLSPVTAQSIYISGDNIWYRAVYKSVLLSVHCRFYLVFCCVNLMGTATKATVQFSENNTFGQLAVIPTIIIQIETFCFYHIGSFSPALSLFIVAHVCTPSADSFILGFPRRSSWNWAVLTHNTIKWDLS